MDLPVRKRMRLQGYDYSQNNAYFITICTQKRAKLFGQIVGDGVLDVPSCDDIPHMLLSQNGATANKYIKNIDMLYNSIIIDKYVIMPNHIHLMIIINNGKYDINDINKIPKEDGTSRTPSPTNAIIPMIISTLKRFTNKDCGFSMFQRSYYDKIIRSEQDYIKIWNYIDTNPISWKKDKFYIE